MPIMTVEFEVFCAECGEGLCNLATVEEGGRFSSSGQIVRVMPCPKCLVAAREEGYEEGKKEAE